MHLSKRLFALGTTTAILISACGGTAATPSPSAAASSAAPSAAASSAAPSAAASSAAPSAAASSAAPSASAVQAPNLKIGVVTDIGTLNDKGYNEYTFKGAEDGATAIGAAAPQSIVPKDASEYAADIKQFIDQKYDIIVTVGFNLTNDTVAAAKANPSIHFVGVDQSPVCVDPQGNPDSTFACKGDAKTLLPNYTSLYFAEDQAGYLAGIVAAYASKNKSIGAIGGTTLCAPCVRYIQGYDMGAKSVTPDIKVTAAYVTNDFSAAAFNDPAGGKAFATTFISTNKPDVLFQVAGKTGNGILEAACQKGIYGIGVDVDQYVSLGAATDPTYGCIITSAEKHVESATSQAIQEIAAKTLSAGDVLFSAANDGIGVSDFHDKASMFGPEVTQALNTALAGMKSGTLKTCPATGCGDAKTPLP
ncbi:MAG: BMP family ABC transporter substrate-binding protein [Candidatus Limnocylindrales bacterium]